MPYSHIASTHNLMSALRYAEGHGGHGHNGQSKRNRYVTGVNLVDCSIVSYADQMRAVLKKAGSRNKTQGRTTIVSFAKSELSPDNPDDVLTAAEIGRQIALTMWPDYQTAIYVQSDGRGKCLHLHLITCNVSVITGKGLENYQTHHPVLRSNVDEICSTYFALSSPTPAKEKVSQSVRTLRRKSDDAYIWQDDLRSRIDASADMAMDWDDFLQNLEANGVRITREGTSKRCGDYITYELTDLSLFPAAATVPKNLRSKSHKLGDNYSRKKIEQKIQVNAAMFAIPDVADDNIDDIYHEDYYEEEEAEATQNGNVTYSYNLRDNPDLTDVLLEDLELYIAHEVQRQHIPAKYLLSQTLESEKQRRHKAKDIDYEY